MSTLGEALEQSRKACPECGLFSPCKTCGRPRLVPVSDLDSAANVAKTLTAERDEAREDLKDMRRDRDSMKTWVAALFAHVCRLGGADPKNAPQEIQAIAKTWATEREALIDERDAARERWEKAERDEHGDGCQCFVCALRDRCER